MFKGEVRNYTLAALYMLACSFSFAVMTALVKGLKYFPVEQVIFFRCFVALLFPIAYLMVTKNLKVLKTDKLKLHLIRAVFGLLAMYCYFSAFSSLPLVEAHSFGRSKPIFITIFAILLLKEHATTARLSAVLLGFVGIIVMLNPGAPNLSLGVLLAITGGFFAALAMICVSVLTRTDSPIAVVVYFMAIGTLVTFCLALPVWQSTTLMELLYLCSVGFFGVLGQIFLVSAYKVGDASYVGPFDYLELVWAAIIGFIVWSELPTVLLVVGISLVVGSQLYMHRAESKS